MPTYEYRCKDCGHEFDANQAFTDNALTECPVCQGSLKKKFGSVGISFKGSGFYKTDTRSTPAAAKAGGGAGAGTSESTSESSGADSPDKAGATSPESTSGSTGGDSGRQSGDKSESTTSDKKPSTPASAPKQPASTKA